MSREIPPHTYISTSSFLYAFRTALRALGRVALPDSGTSNKTHALDIRVTNDIHEWPINASWNAYRTSILQATVLRIGTLHT